MAVRQVRPWEQWPSGDSRPVAVLPQSLAELSQTHGITFEDDTDDLDRYRMAAIALANGQQAWLVKYDNDANPGTVAQVDARADVEEAIALLVSALGIERGDLLWLAPEPLSVR